MMTKFPEQMVLAATNRRAFLKATAMTAIGGTLVAGMLGMVTALVVQR